MSEAWVSVADDADIRQGDVVRSYAPDRQEPTYGVVITADCDIVQRKTNDRITLLRAVPIQDFVVRYWSAWELEKIAEKQGRFVIPFLYSAIKKIDSSVSQLTLKRLIDWLVQNTPDEIFQSLSLQTDRYKKEYGALNAIAAWVSFATDSADSDGFRALSRANLSLGKTGTDIQDRVKEALMTSGGFQDYMVIPNCPDEHRDGLVVLMREIFTKPAQDFLSSAYQARLTDGFAGFVRIGRLRDRVRFAVAQRLAFVFSRIGMEEAYEDNCRTLADLVSLEMKS